MAQRVTCAKDDTNLEGDDSSKSLLGCHHQKAEFISSITLS